MGKAPESRICPNCGTRNKAAWEFCAKCGESLQGVPLGTPAPPPDAAPATPEAYPTSFSWGGLVASVAAIGLAVLAYTYLRQPAPRPASDVFTMGTLPPSAPPAATPLPKEAGRDEYDAGVQRLNANDPKGAAEHFARAVVEAPDTALYHHALAIALWQSGSKEAAVNEHRDSVRLDPENKTYRLEMAKALAGVGQEVEALAEYRRLLAEDPGRPEALHELARLELKRGDRESAATHLALLAERFPNDAVAQQELAGVVENLGNKERAAALYTDILARNPDAHVSRGLLAEIYFQKGDKDQALALFADGLERYPDAPLLHRGMASLLDREGRLPEAIAEYKEYVRRAPEAGDLPQIKARLSRLEKQVASAS